MRRMAGCVRVSAVAEAVLALSSGTPLPAGGVLTVLMRRRKPPARSGFGPVMLRTDGGGRRPWRARRWPCASCGTSRPPWAQAEPEAVELVSNIDQSGIYPGNLSEDVAQAFTTGSHAGGYTLTGVDLKLGGSGPPAYTVSVHADSSGDLGGSLGVLTKPSMPSSIKVVRFGAPGSGIDLEPKTTYWVVLDSSGNGTNIGLRATSSTGEDGGAAAGWTIANQSLFRDFDQSFWRGRTTSVRIAVHGYAKPTAPEAPTGLAATAGNGAVTLSWTAGGDGGSAVTGHKYRRNPGGEGGGYTEWTIIENSAPGPGQRHQLHGG